MKRALFVCSLAALLSIGAASIFHCVLTKNQIEEMRLAKEKKWEKASLLSYEFTLTSEEEAQTGKWKNQSMDDLFNDAIHGDAAGLYMMGLTFLTGSSGFTVDVEKANTFFYMSAALGFAPSLRQVSNMYLEEKKNIFMALVYLNLAASHGHPELLSAYHNTCAAIIEKTNPSMVKEIEKIAEQKQERIEKNSVAVRLSENRLDETTMAFSRLTADDLYYSNDYWIEVLQKTQSLEQESERN